MSESLARRKEDKLSGSNVNYYLEVLENNTVVECEDIIEFLNMSFSAGTVFKSTWRLCKLRKDLGKPGSTKVYEAEKIVYYLKRSLAISVRRSKTFLNRLDKLVRRFKHFRVKDYRYGSLNEVIFITDPKRLEPYSFKISDLIKALGATSAEAEVIDGIITLSLMRNISQYPFEGEVDIVQRALKYGQRIEAYEKAVISS